MLRLARISVLSAIAIAAATVNGHAKHLHISSIPSIGCPSDGQVGPEPAPKLPRKRVRLPAAIADNLTFYRGAYDQGVLGPRGWQCLELEGSNGSILFVMPSLPTKDDLLLGKNGIAGPAIQLTESLGETSGRYEMAKVIARVFPAHISFVQNQISMGPWSAEEFPKGPFPADHLRYHGDSVVEFETPARTQGLGTSSRLLPNGYPIKGIAIVNRDVTMLWLLAMRLPRSMQYLEAHIVAEKIHDVARERPLTDK